MANINYKSILYKLIPRGFIYPQEGMGSDFEKLLCGISEESKRIDCDATDLLNEIMPDQTGRFLEDWERVLGLPLCGVQLGSREERRDMVLAMLNLGEFTNDEFFKTIAAIFGFDVEVVVPTPFRVGSSSVGDRLNGEAQRGTVIIKATCENPQLFRVGESGAGERLIDCSNEGLECIINTFKHSWQYVVFDYS